MSTMACLRFGFSAFSRNAASLLVIGATIAGAQLLVHAALRLAGPQWLTDAVEVVLSGVFIAGLFNACRRAALGSTPRLADALAPLKQRPAQVLAVSLTISAGMLLAGVGILITAFVFVFSLLMVCEGERFTQALSHSKRLVIREPVGVLSLFGALLVLNAVGGMLLGVGLLATTPISVLALIALRLELEAH